jgi:hypothetical protein
MVSHNPDLEKHATRALGTWLKAHKDPKEARRVRKYIQRVIQAGIPNVGPLLPILFSLKGKPYNLNNHFPFTPLFDTNAPTSMILKCARQTGKSLSISSRAVVTTASNPHYNILFVTPLFEMVRRLSTSYVAPFINESPIRHLLMGKKGSANVLHRAFSNGSNMYFSYAYLSADRIRGINSSEVDFDELQNFDIRFLPEIIETTSGSEHGLIRYAGTPMTMENAVEEQWQNSSMAEWIIPCRSCRKDNIPSLDHDLDAMIGPYHEDISEAIPATICANPKCRRPVYPRDGFWGDRHPERLHTFAGIHVPQIIIPHHYASPQRWQRLLNKQNHQEGFTDGKFYNEVCAESYDSGARLITLSELKQAAILPVHSEKDAIELAQSYAIRGIGADWGGGGMSGDSLTKFACGGIGWDGKIDIYYGKVSSEPHDHHKEAILGQKLFAQFDSHVFAHDFAVSGEMRDKFMIDNGFPAQYILPFWYVPGLKQKIMNRVPAKGGRRSYYTLDKPKSLALVCTAIRYGLIRFFPMSGGGINLLKDFLALVENKTERASTGDIYQITRTPGRSDDFAHAVTFLCCALWDRMGMWPQFTPTYEQPSELFNGEVEYHGYDCFTSV